MRGEEGELIESLASSTRHMREKCNTTIEVPYNATNFLLMHSVGCISTNRCLVG